jgi:hypothetical protein
MQTTILWCEFIRKHGLHIFFVLSEKDQGSSATTFVVVVATIVAFAFVFAFSVFSKI